MKCVQGTLAALMAAAMFVGVPACEKKPNEGPAKSSEDTSGCPHEIKKNKCPFCTPSLIEAEGFCGEHGVAEALCYQCRPYLKAAFRAKGDWCAKHSAPDSQCVACHPELVKKAKPGTGHGAQSNRVPLDDARILREFKC